MFIKSPWDNYLFGISKNVSISTFAWWIDRQHLSMFDDTGKKTFFEDKLERMTQKGKALCCVNKRFKLELFCFVWWVICFYMIFIVSYPDVDDNIVYATSNPVYVNTTFTIVMFGDSLTNVPIKYFNLAEKLQHMFPNFDLNIINQGVIWRSNIFKNSYVSMYVCITFLLSWHTLLSSTLNNM